MNDYVLTPCHCHGVFNDPNRAVCLDCHGTGHVMAVGVAPGHLDPNELQERLNKLNRKQRRGVLARAKKVYKRSLKK